MPGLPPGQRPGYRKPEPVPRHDTPPSFASPASMPPEAVGKLLGEVSTTSKRVGALETKVGELDRKIGDVAVSVKEDVAEFGREMRGLMGEIMRSKDADREQLKSLHGVELKAQATAMEVEAMAKGAARGTSVKTSGAIVVLVEIGRAIVDALTSK
jgi:hypothetical protein